MVSHKHEQKQYCNIQQQSKTWEWNRRMSRCRGTAISSHNANWFSLFTSFYPKPISDPLNDSPGFSNWCKSTGFPGFPPNLTCLNYRDNHSSLNTSSILSIFLCQCWIKAFSLKSWGSLVRGLVELAWISCQRPLVAFWVRKLENGRAPAPQNSTIPFPSFWLFVECYSIVSVRFCGKTISYVIKRIEMIADALVAGTKLMKSQFVTFAVHPLGIQQIFLTVFNTPQSCFHEKSIENCRNHAS